MCVCCVNIHKRCLFLHGHTRGLDTIQLPAALAKRVYNSDTFIEHIYNKLKLYSVKQTSRRDNSATNNNSNNGKRVRVVNVLRN